MFEPRLEVVSEDPTGFSHLSMKLGYITTRLGAQIFVAKNTYTICQQKVILLHHDKAPTHSPRTVTVKCQLLRRSPTLYFKIKLHWTTKGVQIVGRKQILFNVIVETNAYFSILNQSYYSEGINKLK